MTTLHLRKSISPECFRGCLLIAFALCCFALSPTARAVLPSPTPDGGYPGQNTAEGTNALFSLTTGTQNTAIGFQALQNTTTSYANTAVGFRALFSLTTGSDTTGYANTAIGLRALYSNTTGRDNTAIGTNTLVSNTTGSFNTATSQGALGTNTTGNNNTAYGEDALGLNTTGNDNTATGFRALVSNTGIYNTANGSGALFSNTTGHDNTAVGYQALYSNTSESQDAGSNTAVGSQALFLNTTGWANTAVGNLALYNNTGTRNTATGDFALFSNTTGDRNIGTGYAALGSNTTGGHNVAYGNSALSGNTTGNYNTALGYSAGWNLTAGDNNIIINNVGVGTETNTIRIGSQVAAVAADGSTQAAHRKTFIAGIQGSPITGTSVVVNPNGRLGTVASSQRFKNDIKPMDKASEAVLALNPVTFRYKKGIDPQGILQFGLVAEDVEKVNPDLVVRDKEGKPYTVRYDAVNAMLLNEFLKEHRKVQEQEATITQLKKDFGATIAQLTARLDEQAAQIQKVSTQLEASKPAPQVANNP